MFDGVKAHTAEAKKRAAKAAESRYIMVVAWLTGRHRLVAFLMEATKQQLIRALMADGRRSQSSLAHPPIRPHSTWRRAGEKPTPVIDNPIPNSYLNTSTEILKTTSFPTKQISLTLG